MQRIFPAFIALSLFAAACSQVSDSGTSAAAAPTPTPTPSFVYSDEFRAEIVASCTEAAGGEQDLCVCIVDVLERNVPPEEVTRLGQPLDPANLITSDLPPEFTNAFAQCAVDPSS